jgi:hypothetical protein
MVRPSIALEDGPSGDSTPLTEAITNTPNQRVPLTRRGGALDGVVRVAASSHSILYAEFRSGDINDQPPQSTSQFSDVWIEERPWFHRR